MIDALMPTTGIEWVADQEAAKSGPNQGFKPPDCAWNVAWNELHKEGNGAENDPNAVAACVATLVNDYNDGVSKGQIQGGHHISNADVVTTDQLTSMAGDAEATAKAANPPVPKSALKAE